MVADIARVTYDPTRQYRSLIWQQGRVTLEADNNEAEIIEGEALRLETIDIVGPAGTPDNGYAVSSGKGPAGVVVGPGIFYLGGWRLELDAAFDMPGSANSKEDVELARSGGDFVVSLLITERSVCAVEDQALREVALGGPDSAARMRLMQTFPRLAISGDTCAAAAVTVAGLLKEDGVTIDPYSYQLMSGATLQANFVPGPPSSDPCTPAAAGGYLGADNQMVQVTVTAFDAKAQTGTLLWGWNNASLLYRATASDPLTLTLTNTPVDQEHAPQQNQFVEILRTDLDLGDDNYIANGQGFVVSLAQAYSFDTGQIVLSSPLPSDYQNNTKPLFVRLWQAEVPFNAGVQTPLDNVSGITVAIAMTALPSHIAGRPFWNFAVRPSMPQNIYPQRYYDAPQPPEGPRQWICDLAVAKALESGCTVLESCRPTFTSLTQMGGGCCGLVLSPDDVVARGGLQSVVDSLAGGPAVLSLLPGTYPLSESLKLTKSNNGLVIEGCSSGVVLAASASNLPALRTGLILMDGVEDITLRELELTAPEVASATAKRGTKADATSQATTLCAVLVGDASGLTIEGCTFTLDAVSTNVFGGGVLIFGATSGVEISGNSFTASARDGAVFGVLAWVSDTSAATQMDQWDLSENRFENLFCGALGYAQLGLVSCRHNVVVGCGAGIVLAEANLGETSGFTREALTVAGATDPMAQAANAALRPDILASVIDGGAPILAALPTPPTAPAVSDVAKQTLADQLRATGAAAYHTLAGAAAPADTAATATAIDTASFDKLDAAALSAELRETALTPALRFEDNEVTLTAAAAAPWVGLDAILSADEPGSVIVSGNRVVVPDDTTVACALLAPYGAVVSGNIFVQLVVAGKRARVMPCLAVVTASPAIAISANVVIFTDYIVPQRAAPAATGSWEFLNTVL
jgi:hypothetical protein